MFTQLNNPVVEESLARQMRLVVAETTKVYGKNCSIILAGGFGRGEGSVQLTDTGQALPLHDYDLFIITDQKIDPQTHATMQRKIMLGISELTKTSLEDFVIGMQVIPTGSLTRLPPDLSTVELKIASTVLHGPDVRWQIPATQQDIALGSGVITLFHRVIALLKNVEPEYLESSKYPKHRALEAVYECCKIYTEICTALSLLGDFYEPSYGLRARKFQSNFHRFPELQRELPRLGQLIRAYTDMKLRSDFSQIIGNPVETWIEARKTLLTSLRYYLSRFLKIDSKGSWPDLCQRADTRLRQFFFRDYISFYLSRIGVRGSAFIYMANFLLQMADSFSFWRKLRFYGRQPALRPVSLSSPILSTYMSSVLVLTSLLDNGTIDPELLAASRRYMQRVYDGGSKVEESDVNSWNEAREDCVETQRLYFGMELRKRRIF